MEKYDEANNPSFAPDAPQNTDFRWRLLPVSPERLNIMVRGGVLPGVGVPPDLTVITVDTVTHGGWWVLLVWSEHFSPILNDGTHRLEAIPFTGPGRGWA